MEPLDKVEALVVHHTGPPSSATTTPEAIRRYHVVDLGWADVGYHFLVHRDRATGQARVSVGRPATLRGAHCHGYNRKSLGIALVGDYSHEAPAPDLWALLVESLSLLVWAHGLQPADVVGHREADPFDEARGAPRTCPGEAFDLDKLRRAVLASLT